MLASPLLPILPRCNPFNLLEDPSEIIGIGNPALYRDLFNGERGEPQQTLGLGDAQLQQIAVDGHTILLRENFAKVKLVDVKLLAQLIQGDLLLIVLVQIIFYSLQVAALFGYMGRPVGVPGFLHQIGRASCSERV